MSTPVKVSVIGVGSAQSSLRLVRDLCMTDGLTGSQVSFKTGNRSMVLWDALNSHRTHSYDQAVDVLDDMLAMDGSREMAEQSKFPANW